MYSLLLGAVFAVFFSYKNETIVYFDDGSKATASLIQLALDDPKSISQPLPDPPEIIKAIYLTGWSAGTMGRVDYAINLVRNTEINAVIVDVKDYSGAISYDSELPLLNNYGAEEEIKILDLAGLVERFHKEGIYVIARITVFQDPVLARARPDLAVRSLSTGGLWLDRKGLAWIDPGAKEAWDYTVLISKDVLRYGFDELNFDYVRFPTDGDMSDAVFPRWEEDMPRHLVLRGFFRYLRYRLPDQKLSVDFFGQTTIDYNDSIIGQVIEDAYEFFDVVAPMVYPSHYVNGFLGFENPAEHPYEVIKYSMDSARDRLTTYNQQLTTNNESLVVSRRLSVNLRPWLQDFNLGADYDADMVRAEIQAVQDSLGSDFAGYMLWNPSNFYTREALMSDE